MTQRHLESMLEAATTRLQRAVEALRPRHRGGEIEEFQQARDAVLAVERDLAAARGEPYAVPLPFPVEWDSGAPLPVMLVSDQKTLLLFRVRVPNPAWDGSYATPVGLGDPESERLALAEFTRCASAKLGAPNDEVFHGHPLYGRGFEGGRALKVMDSPWLQELRSINEVHSEFRSDAWARRTHFILPFHDSTFECVAESFTVDVVCMPMAQALAELCRRMVEN